MMRHTVLVGGKPYAVTIRRWSSRVWTAAAECMEKPVETAGGSPQLALFRWLQAATLVSNEVSRCSGPAADEARARKTAGNGPTPPFVSVDHAFDAQGTQAAL